jgi:RNA polymerase sigma-70 factor (ECF subfamily)
MDTLTDFQLITLYKDGNTRAFEGLINRYGQVLYRYIFRLISNDIDAQDIVQETFIKSWKNINKYDISKSFRTWIFTIAHRTAIDYLRKRKNISFSSLDDYEEYSFEQNIPDNDFLPDEIFEKAEMFDLIQGLLKALPLENKTIILLHLTEEMTFDEISNVMDKPLNTVKSQYRRTLIELRKQIAPKL